MKRLLFCLFLTSSLCYSCKEPDTPGGGDEPTKVYYINLKTTSLDFSHSRESKTFTVETNIDAADLACKTNDSWCSATIAAGVVTVSVDASGEMNSRSTTVYVEGKNVRQPVKVNQQGIKNIVTGIPGDVRIPVVSSSVSPAAQNGEGIELSHDGNMSTYYHSNWSVSVTPASPVTLIYNFKDAERMDYLVYNPRTNGTNGNFKELEVWVAAGGEAAKLYGSYDFEGSGSGSIISFSPALVNPTQIQFVVKSGNSDSKTVTGFAACAEMQFFKSGSSSFDWSTIFTDQTCSELKPGIGKTEIDKIEGTFFRDLATRILEGTYESEFRVQEYRAWEHPDVMSKKNKSGTYSLRDNPTGMYAKAGEEFVVLAGDLGGRSVSLFVQNPDERISGSSFTLKPGVNKFTSEHSGLIYVIYQTRNWTGKEPKIKINIATGHVNGYFDTSKHKPGEWTTRLAAATFRHFDLVGKYSHMTFETSAFRQYTPDGTVLVEKYDDMVLRQQQFMGLEKYDRMYNNRMYFVVMNTGWMVAGGYYTGYVTGSQSTVLKLNEPTADMWGPAHEAGHINMVRPDGNWTGMGEVANNILSLAIQTAWGKRSRLLDVAEGRADRYVWAFDDILDKGICYNTHSDVFCKLIPFWQLKLYMHDVLGKTDFYGDLYELLRQRTSATTAGAQMLGFVKAACDAAELDLTDFFTAWGFLKPVDVFLSDYSSSQFTVTQAMIDEVMAYVAAKGYAKPAHSFERIRDDNLAEYK